MRLRVEEEKRPLYDYLRPELNPRFEQHLIRKNVFLSDYPERIEDYKELRSYAIQKIMNMHHHKNPDSFFTAIQIYDTFLENYGQFKFQSKSILCLTMACYRLALKFETHELIKITDIEPVLNDKDFRFTQKQLNEMEFLVLKQLSFDFNFPSYTQPIERFLRLLDFDFVKSVHSMTYKIVMLAMNDSSFLSCRPTIMAASSIIISINIYK